VVSAEEDEQNEIPEKTSNDDRPPQHWFAKQTGIERSKLSLMENRRLKPTREEESALEKALVAAMRENVAEFSRLSGTTFKS
jgi:hypothetical protein